MEEMSEKGGSTEKGKEKIEGVHGENQVTCQLHDGIPRRTLKKETRVPIYRCWSMCRDH